MMVLRFSVIVLFILGCKPSGSSVEREKSTVSNQNSLDSVSVNKDWLLPENSQMEVSVITFNPGNRWAVPFVGKLEFVPTVQVCGYYERDRENSIGLGDVIKCEDVEGGKFAPVFPEKGKKTLVSEKVTVTAKAVNAQIEKVAKKPAFKGHYIRLMIYQIKNSFFNQRTEIDSKARVHQSKMIEEGEDVGGEVAIQKDATITMARFRLIQN